MPDRSANAMRDEAAETLARLLATLRREGRQQHGLDPRLVPPDADAAYRVAALVAKHLGWSVGGWKIAATKAKMQRALRATTPIYGRVFAPFVRESPATLVHAALLHPVAECELVARLGADLPPRARPYTRDDVASAVVSLHAGMEIAECRFVPDATFPPLPAILADGSGSGSVVVGPAIADWRRDDAAGQEVVLRIDGTERRRGRARDAIGDPLEPLTWLANALSRTGVGLAAGAVVSTGTITGMVRARAGEAHVADWGSFGEVRVTFTS